MFDVDSGRKYTFSLLARARNFKGDDRSLVYAGFNVFDKDGRRILCRECAGNPKTFTTVAADAKRGDKVLMIKDGSSFSKAAHCSVVADAKADYSDLPNRNVIGCAIGKIEKSGDVWKLEFVKPLQKDVKTGTAIRQHSDGGYVYIPGFGNCDEKWKVMKGAVKGINKGLGWSGPFWPKGTVKAQAVLIINYNKKSLDTEIKDAVIFID